MKQQTQIFQSKEEKHNELVIQCYKEMEANSSKLQIEKDVTMTETNMVQWQAVESFLKVQKGMKTSDQSCSRHKSMKYCIYFPIFLMK